MAKFWRRSHSYDPSRPHHQNVLDKNIHDGEENIDERLHNVREGHKGTGQPAQTPAGGQGTGNIDGAAVKIIGVGIGLLFVGSLVMQGVEKVREGYNDAETWLHNKTAPSRTTGETAPKTETGNSTATRKPAQPVKKAPVPEQANVYRQMPQGTTLLPSREYLSDATNDALTYVREQSGSSINKGYLKDFAKDSAKGIDRPFTQGMIDGNGETLEVIMGVFNGVGRHAVVCLGGKDGIRSVTHMYMGATPENLEVSFLNSVTTSTGQNINLKEIANRASQCHEVTSALQKIDPKLRFVLQ